NNAAALFVGGAHTIVSSLKSMLLALILYPEVQRRAQQEIDEVVGGDRLPKFQDRHHLPYVKALVKETYRWTPVMPVGTTHVTEEEMVFSGHRIPKGAFLLPIDLVVHARSREVRESVRVRPGSLLGAAE
ncbi:hypothetical protein E4U58_000766, partial [Claviceps cyperi]